MTTPAPPPDEVQPQNFGSLVDLFNQYELVEVHKASIEDGLKGIDQDFIVVTPRTTNALSEAGFRLASPDSSDVNMQELGNASPSPWLGQREYNPAMRGQIGLRNLDKMRRSDATVRASLRLAKTPVLAAHWYMEPASESARDKNVADFIWKNLTEWMSMSWPQFLTESLLMLDFGYYMYEKVFDFGEAVTSDPMARGRIVWRKFGSRHPMDVIQWNYDDNGGPDSVEMVPRSTGQNITIPIKKLLVFTYDKEGGDMEGMSLLRSAYRNWYFKDALYKIDAIQKERHGIGVPIIVLPPGYSDADKRLADQMGRNLRTNERAHVVLPPNWSVGFADLKGQPVNVMTSIEHHDSQIEKNILAPFMNGKTTTKPEDQDLFLKATRFVANIVLDVINKWAIPELVDINWSRVGYPKMCARRIGEVADWRTISFAMRNFIGAGVIRPDDRLEAYTREEMDLPKADPATAREIATPQQPGQGGPGQGGPDTTPPSTPRIGPPRQKTSPPVGTPDANSGRDRSGG